MFPNGARHFGQPHIYLPAPETNTYHYIYITYVIILLQKSDKTFLCHAIECLEGEYQSTTQRKQKTEIIYI